MSRPSLAARVVLAPIRFYMRFISPTRLPTCRYLPTCSEYAVEALQTHGAVRGGWLALRRLLRCHPWHRGGHDPVPPAVGSGIVTRPRRDLTDSSQESPVV